MLGSVYFTGLTTVTVDITYVVTTVGYTAAGLQCMIVSHSLGYLHSQANFNPSQTTVLYAVAQVRSIATGYWAAACSALNADDKVLDSVYLTLGTATPPPPPPPAAACSSVVPVDDSTGACSDYTRYLVLCLEGSALTARCAAGTVTRNLPTCPTSGLAGTVGGRCPDASTPNLGLCFSFDSAQETVQCFPVPSPPPDPASPPPPPPPPSPPPALPALSGTVAKVKARFTLTVSSSGPAPSSVNYGFFTTAGVVQAIGSGPYNVATPTIVDLNEGDADVVSYVQAVAVDVAGSSSAAVTLVWV
ncbi:hypothetical protein ACKKBF_B05045 [Auxenochlorella protothecoides x Auxenochlorella symbiontica]